MGIAGHHLMADSVISRWPIIIIFYLHPQRGIWFIFTRFKGHFFALFKSIVNLVAQRFHNLSELEKRHYRRGIIDG